jgi:hypothetical protein
MTALLDTLAKYVSALDQSARGTHRAEDRLAYTRHLAAAAQFFVAAHAGRIADLQALVASERHAFGWGHLSDAEGSAAEKAFDDFAKVLEATNAT